MSQHVRLLYKIRRDSRICDSLNTVAVQGVREKPHKVQHIINLETFAVK